MKEIDPMQLIGTVIYMNFCTCITHGMAKLKVHLDWTHRG